MNFKGTVLSIGQKPLVKSNGKEFLLCNVELTVNGKKLVVTAQYTIKEDGTTLTVGQEISVYRRVLPSTTGKGVKNFFEVSRNITSSDDEINALLGIPEEEVATS